MMQKGFFPESLYLIHPRFHPGSQSQTSTDSKEANFRNYRNRKVFVSYHKNFLVFIEGDLYCLFFVLFT